MSKKITALALAVAFIAMPAFAAVQNVRVSGDIDAKGIYQEDFDLKAESKSGATTSNADDEGFFLSTARVRIDADLTDNVSTTVRLLNQRKWGTDSAAASDVELNLGYITLKELLYSPLTLTIGRQDITVGRGFIVGAGLLQDPNSVFGTNGGQYSAYNSYDAIKAVLDYNPLTLTALAIKVNETGTSQNDSDIYGINLGYKPGQLDSELEAYWFLKKDESFNSDLGLAGSIGTRTYETNIVHTIGIRGSVVPTGGLTLLGEIAYQTGEVRDHTGGAPAGSSAGDVLDRDRKAWAANLEGSYDFSNVTYTPKLGLGWTFYSGEEASNSGDLEAWDSMTRGLFFTAIHDFLAGSQSTGGLYTTVDPDDSSATTNSHIFYVDGSLKPLDDLAVSLRYATIRFDEAPVAGRAKRAGDEIDVQLSYHYTEDVHLGLLAGWFIPGKYYDGQTTASSRSNDTAAIVAGSVSVAF